MRAEDRKEDYQLREDGFQTCHFLGAAKSELGHFGCWMDQKCGIAFICENPFKRDVHNNGTSTCKLNGAPMMRNGWIQRASMASLT